MNRDSTYCEKLLLLKEWMPAIVESVKKELKNEHLKGDFAFQKRYLGGKNLNKVELQELSQAYSRALEEEGSEELAEFIANRWIFKHGDIYHHFEQALRKINEDFTAIESLSEAQSSELIGTSCREFGALNTYLFSVLNAVAFSEKEFKTLGEMAREEAKAFAAEEKRATEEKSVEQMVKAHALEISRLTDRYEKKLVGMQKKYVQDVETLKKQVSTLQKKLAGAS